jgi:hypothetical protein
MNDVSIGFELKRNTYGEFIIDLYSYLLEVKQCIYIKLIFDPKIYNKLEYNIIDKIFESHTCEDLKDSAFYMENLYDEASDEDSFNVGELIEKIWSEYEVAYRSFKDSKLIQGVITDFSYSNIKSIQKLNYDQIMFFTKMNEYDSMILGAYDNEEQFSISKLDLQDVNAIKELFSSKFDIENLELNVYDGD